MRRFPIGMMALCACLAAGVAARAEPAAPKRIVSINLCSDILAAGLAAPGTLKSVFRLAHDPEDSPVAALVRDIPANDGRIEDILPFAPDLVLAHEYSSPFTLDLIRRIGVPVVTVKDARNLAGIRDNITAVAAALGREARGVALIADFDRDMKAAHRDTAKRPAAILYQNLGSAAAPNSIPGQLLDHTGFRNVITETSPVGLVYPGIEDVIELRPELIALGIYRPGQPSQAGALLQHPALRLYREHYAREIRLRASDWVCSTHIVARVAARLAAAHDAMTANKTISALSLPEGQTAGRIAGRDK